MAQVHVYADGAQLSFTPQRLTPQELTDACTAQQRSIVFFRSYDATGFLATLLKAAATMTESQIVSVNRTDVQGAVGVAMEMGGRIFDEWLAAGNTPHATPTRPSPPMPDLLKIVLADQRDVHLYNGGTLALLLVLALSQGCRDRRKALSLCN